jgi:hypothetical protein
MSIWNNFTIHVKYIFPDIRIVKIIYNNLYSFDQSDLEVDWFELGPISSFLAMLASQWCLWLQIYQLLRLGWQY